MFNKASFSLTKNHFLAKNAFAEEIFTSERGFFERILTE
jgi:hypothetical protein